MAQNHGAPRQHKVDVFPAVHVREAAAVGLGDEQGQAVHIVAGTHRAVDAAGDQRAGFFKQLAGKIVHLRFSFVPGGMAVRRNTSWIFFSVP